MDTIARVKELADERNLSLKDISRLSGLNYGNLKRAEVNHGQLRINTIESICIGLGITMYQFFDCGGCECQRSC